MRRVEGLEFLLVRLDMLELQLIVQEEGGDEHGQKAEDREAGEIWRAAGLDRPLAGIEQGALMALYFADEALIVTNPEISAVRDSDRILGILQSQSQRAEQGQEPIKEHLIISRYDPNEVNRGDMLSIDDILDILAIPMLGVIPESKAVLQSSNAGIPVIMDESSDAGQAYWDVVCRFLGEEVPHRFIDIQRKPFFKRLFG
jgi:septum site-determining protein MinD